VALSGDLALDQAELGDGLAEGDALFGVANHVRQRVARAADAGHAQLEAAHVEHVEGDVVALAGLAQQVRGGDFAVLKHQRAGGGAANAQLVLFRADGQARRVRSMRNAENFSPSILAKTVYRLGDAAVGDPHLLAVEDVVAAVGESVARVRTFMASEPELASESA
jgi:hypothetical protein